MPLPLRPTDLHPLACAQCPVQRLRIAEGQHEPACADDEALALARGGDVDALGSQRLEARHGRAPLGTALRHAARMLVLYAADRLFGLTLTHADQQARQIGVAAPAALLALLLDLHGALPLALCRGEFARASLHVALCRVQLLVALMPVQRVVPSVVLQAAARHLVDRRHVAEQLAVMADDQRAAAVGAQPLAQPRPGVPVEMVARFVEDQIARAIGKQSQQVRPGQFTAAELRGRPREVVGQPGFGQPVLPARGKLPVVTHLVEIGAVDAAGLDPCEGSERRPDAEHITQRALVMRWRLRQHANRRMPAHRARGRRQFAREQAREQALARTVAPHQPMAVAWEFELDGIKQNVATGGDERKIAYGNRGHRSSVEQEWDLRQAEAPGRSHALSPGFARA